MRQRSCRWPCCMPIRQARLGAWQGGEEAARLLGSSFWLAPQPASSSAGSRPRCCPPLLPSSCPCPVHPQLFAPSKPRPAYPGLPPRRSPMAPRGFTCWAASTSCPTGTRRPLPTTPPRCSWTPCCGRHLRSCVPWVLTQRRSSTSPWLQQRVRGLARPHRRRPRLLVAARNGEDLARRLQAGCLPWLQRWQGRAWPPQVAAASRR